MRIPQYFRLASAASLLVFILALGASAVGAASAPNGGVIGGQVTSPGGYPLEERTLVKLFEPGTENVRGISEPDRFTGIFQFPPVRNGLYVIKAVPPEGSPYTQSLPKPVSVVNAPVNVGILALTEPQITGSVLAPDGITLVESQVLVYLGNGQILQHVPAPGGEFKIGGLTVGGYGLQAFPSGEDPYWRSERTPVSITNLEDVQIVDLSLQEADLWGTVQDDQGNPIPKAKVIAADQNGGINSELSNPSGYWAIGGLEDGSYKLSALPPWPKSGLLPPEPVDVTLPGASNPYELIFNSPPKIVRGMVSTNTGQPVYHALILARRVNLPGNVQGLSGADGKYQLKLSPGLWALSVQPTGDTLPMDWIYTLPPQFVFFHADNQPETRQQDFTVTLADATVIGSVTMPDGSPPPFTVTVGLHSDEGAGRRTIIDPDGDFSLSVPNGRYKVFIHPDDPGYIGPLVEPILVPPEEAVDLGELTLLARDAMITGTVSSGGAGISSISIVAWRPGAPGSLKTTSGEGGQYGLAVAEGKWHIQPAPSSDQPYLYTGPGEDIEISSGAAVPDVDFELLETDGTITGILVNSSGEPVSDAFGWAVATQVGNPQVHNGAPIENGTFTILVPAGLYHVVAHLPAGGPYTSTGQRQVNVPSGGSEAITLTVLTKNAKIGGALWDPRNQDVVEGLAGLVGAWSQGNWVVTPIQEANGTFEMDVAAGLWRLNFRIDPLAEYVKVSEPLNVAAQQGTPAIVPLAVLPKDGALEGTVLDPQGNPLSGATVIAKRLTRPANELWLKTQSGENGSFRLDLPSGSYRLGAAGGDPAWINPFERVVEGPVNGLSSGHELQFRLSDITVSGTLTVSHTTESGMAHVWGWSDDGAFAQSNFPVTSNGSQATGSYTLGIVSGMTWNLGAVFETSSQYWFGRAKVIAASDPVVQDIVLQGPYPKPAPVATVFDPSEPQQISLADGTHIFIPAGAMPVNGPVTLRIVPVAMLPFQQHANIYKYGYAFLATDQDGAPIEQHFNQDVLISFSYQQAELNQLRINERWLKPAYYSTTMDRWVFPESFVVDMDANRVMMQIDHFTDYALTMAPTSSLFLPLLIR